MTLKIRVGVGLGLNWHKLQSTSKLLWLPAATNPANRLLDNTTNHC